MTETNNISNEKYDMGSFPEKPKIIIDDAIKIYKRGKIEVVALRGLNAEFYPGEITVIMGPSGCGKTTLLNMIGGLDRLNSGKIIVEGNNIAQYSDSELERFRRNHIGFVFQFMNLIPELTARENITLPLELSHKLTKEKEKEIDHLLSIVGLAERAMHRPDELSGGEQQRISIAAALANDPDIILCDEPTGELDSDSKLGVMQLLRKIIDEYPEKTILIVTHDPELKQIADRMYYIRDGKISHTFNKEELKKMRENQDEIQGDGIKSYNKEQAKKMALTELREVEHILREKIQKIEKELHPV